MTYDACTGSTHVCEGKYIASSRPLTECGASPLHHSCPNLALILPTAKHVHTGVTTCSGGTLSRTVRSSSLLPWPESMSTDGLIQTGGTGMWVISRYSGRSAMSSRMQSSAVTAEKRDSTRKGLRSSATCRHAARVDYPCLSWVQGLRLDCPFRTPSWETVQILPIY